MELIVATGITLVLATMLIGITSGMLSAWNRSRGKLTSSNQAKLALDQLAEDLAGAFYRSDGNTWFAATIMESNNPLVSLSNGALASQRNWVVSGSDSTELKPRTGDTGGGERTFDLGDEDINTCRFGMAGVWLRFITTKKDDNSGSSDMSAPAVVSYQIVRRRIGSSSSECAYILHRSLVRPNGTPSTFSVGCDLNAADYNTPSTTDGFPGTILSPLKQHAIANHVIDFGVRLYVREAGALRLIFPAIPSVVGATPAVGTPSDSDVEVPAAELEHLSRATAVVSIDAYRNRFPDVVEVSLRVLSDEGARLIQSLEAGKITGDWWDIAEANSTVYTRKIDVKGRGL